MADDEKTTETEADESGAVDVMAGETGLLDGVKPAEKAKEPASDRADLAAKDDEKPEEEAKVYDPGGLPDGMLGKTDRETVDNLLKAYKNARKAIGDAKPKGVPKDAEEYAIEADGDEDVIAEALNAEGNKEIMAGVRAAALKHGLSKAQFAGFVRDVMVSAKEMAIDGAGEEFNLEAEVEELGGRQKAGALINGISGWLTGLHSQGVLSEADLEEAKIMAGTAKGLRVMSKLRDLSGEKPIPLHAAAGAVKSKDELNAMLADPRYMGDGPEAEKYRAEVDAEFQKFYGTSSAGLARGAA